MTESYHAQMYEYFISKFQEIMKDGCGNVYSVDYQV